VAPSVLGKGVSVSEGAVVGHLVVTMEQLQEGDRLQKSCILVTTEHFYAPVAALKMAAGLLILRGERNSFAATVMRKMGKPAVVDILHLTLNEDSTALISTFQSEPRTLHIGDTITVDASTGMIYAGKMPTVSVGQDEDFQMVMKWASKFKRLLVLADIESHEELILADNMGAEGVGSLKTNFMFSKEQERLDIFRQAILEDNRSDRSKCLQLLLTAHQADFLEMFCFMDRRQVTADC
jgi:pyruvate,orthophosphate dikinase